ncbi:MAG: hypothetical protein L0Y72_23580 [Gemmataceae bacterium]|nr:hypothetical protein [Gemmataceae bacterium]MCI0742026.1 hypothetical protein [Gemmataceae bacterium]
MSACLDTVAFLALAAVLSFARPEGWTIIPIVAAIAAAALVNWWRRWRAPPPDPPSHDRPAAAKSKYPRLAG